MDETSNCHPAWVPSDLNLADSLTKYTTDSMRTIALYHSRKSWILKFENDFVSARKQARLRRLAAVQKANIANTLEEWCEDPFSRTFGVDIIR
jgi:hypothetical protein